MTTPKDVDRAAFVQRFSAFAEAARQLSDAWDTEHFNADEDFGDRVRVPDMKSFDEWTLEVVGIAADLGRGFTNTCKHCGRTFQLSRTFDVCESCWYGADAEERFDYEALLDALKAEGLEGELWHTGGGIYVVRVGLVPGDNAQDGLGEWYALITDSEGELPRVITAETELSAGFYHYDGDVEDQRDFSPHDMPLPALAASLREYRDRVQAGVV